jgi:hypothetical protein
MKLATERLPSGCARQSSDAGPLRAGVAPGLVSEAPEDSDDPYYQVLSVDHLKLQRLRGPRAPPAESPWFSRTCYARQGGGGALTATLSTVYTAFNMTALEEEDW